MCGATRLTGWPGAWDSPGRGPGQGADGRRAGTSRAAAHAVSSAGVPCTENDYKLWSPSDERGSQCLLGHKTVFKRRTPHATCFNGEDFDRPVVVANCSCTRADYEWWVPRCLGGVCCLLRRVGREPAWPLP